MEETRKRNRLLIEQDTTLEKSQLTGASQLISKELNEFRHNADKWDQQNQEFISIFTEATKRIKDESKKSIEAQEKLHYLKTKYLDQLTYYFGTVGTRHKKVLNTENTHTKFHRKLKLREEKQQAPIAHPVSETIKVHQPQASEFKSPDLEIENESLALSYSINPSIVKPKKPQQTSSLMYDERPIQEKPVIQVKKPQQKSQLVYGQYDDDDEDY